MYRVSVPYPARFGQKVTVPEIRKASLAAAHPLEMVRAGNNQSGVYHPPLTSYVIAFHSPMVLPSGSENQENWPCGSVMTGVRALPPSAVALSR
jgi:hypothetical protein